jgi:nitrous oxide reductase accessory protein NosL
MPIVSTSSGEVFESSVEAFFAGIKPTKVLAKDHLFRTLWLDLLNALTTPEKCNNLVDAYVSLFLGDPQWRQSSSLIDTHRAIYVISFATNLPMS